MRGRTGASAAALNTNSLGLNWNEKIKTESTQMYSASPLFSQPSALCRLFFFFYYLSLCCGLQTCQPSAAGRKEATSRDLVTVLGPTTVVLATIGYRSLERFVGLCGEGEGGGIFGGLRELLVTGGRALGMLGWFASSRQDSAGNSEG